MTGVFVVPGYMVVRFEEDDRLRELLIPLNGDEMIGLAGMLLQAAAQTPPQPQPQPGAAERRNAFDQASRN